MPRFLIELDYDGRGFQGTQAQASGRTLQGVLGGALGELTGDATTIRLSSRLDAEVSARRLPFDCWCERAWPPTVLAQALTARLPPDVSVTRIAPVADSFNAKTDAVAKTYAFTVLRRWSRPALEPLAWWVRQIDHPERLVELAALLPCHHDLSAFACLRHDGTDDDDPRRTIHDAAWTTTADAPGERLTFRISGSGFLYKQIRGLVGAMIYVAQGRRSVAEFAAAMAGGRTAERIGNIAPGHGLLLERVDYRPEPPWVEPAPAPSEP